MVPVASVFPRVSGLTVAIAAALLIHPVSHPAAPMDVGNHAVTVGDTLVPVFAVRTDTILAVGRYTDSLGGHSFVLAKRCGISVAFAGWAVRKNGVTSAPIVRDSVTLSVGAAALSGVNGDTSVDLTTLPQCGTSGP